MHSTAMQRSGLQSSAEHRTVKQRIASQGTAMQSKATCWVSSLQPPTGGCWVGIHLMQRTGTQSREGKCMATQRSAEHSTAQNSIAAQSRA